MDTTDSDAAAGRPRPRGVWHHVAPYFYSLLAALVLLGVTEVVIRAFWPQVVRFSAVKYGTTEEVSWAVEDSVLGHRLRPAVLAVERAPEYTAHYLTGPEGFRISTDPARAGAVAPRPDTAPGTILVLGDSFGFGNGSEWEDAWATRLEALIGGSNARRVVNASVPGYDTRAEALMLDRVIERYRPSVVIITFLTNDLFTNLPVDAPDSAVSEVEHRVGDLGASKISALQSVILAKRLAMQSDRLYSSLYLMTPRKEYFTQPMSPHLQKQVETTRALLARAHRTTQAHGAQLVVLSIPQLFQVLQVSNGYDRAPISSTWVDSIFAADAARAGYKWLPSLGHLAERTRNGDGGIFYRYDGHLTPHGNEIIAEFVAAHIAREAM